MTTTLGFVYILEGATGKARDGWPLQLAPVQGSAALADVDGCGRLELIVADEAGTVAALKVSAVNGSSIGSMSSSSSSFENNNPLILWERHLGAAITATPALGDVDGDGDLEIVVGDAAGGVWCLDARSGLDANRWQRGKRDVAARRNALWPWKRETEKEKESGSSENSSSSSSSSSALSPPRRGARGRIVAAPLLVPLGDPPLRPGWHPPLRVVVPAFDGMLYAISGDGACADSVDLGEASYSRPLADDIDGDGALEIVLATMSGSVHALKAGRAGVSHRVGGADSATAAAAAAKISETAHRAAELTLGAVMPPGTTTEDLVRASKEGLWSALSAARGLAAGAVAAAAQASDAAVEGTRQQYHAVVEAAKEAVAANNSSLSSDALESFRPEDGSAVLGAFHAELNDLVSSSSSLFPPAPRRIRGALFVTSSSVLFLVSRAHQALGRAVSRAVTASAAEASSASLGTASSELGGFLGAALAAEDAERAAREAEEAAGLPAAGTVAAIPLGAIGRVEVVVAGAGDGGSGGDGDGVGRNALVVFLKEGCSGNEGSSSVTFSGFGAPSDADEALALVEHLLGEGKEGEEEAEEKK